MTPAAMKRTAFEKNGRPDARAVMDGKTFDVEYQAFDHESASCMNCNISHIMVFDKREFFCLGV
jgi:hypothetical protein